MFVSKLKTAVVLVAVLAAMMVGAWALHVPAGEAMVTATRPAAPPPPPAAPADAQADLDALLDKAIASAGGAKLAKFTAGTCKIQGKMLRGDEAFALDALLQGANQLKLEGAVEHQGRQRKLAIVLNGDKCWAKFEDKLEDTPKEIILGVKDVIRTFRYVHALTPLKDKGVTLSPLGEFTVEGKPALGLKVGCKDEKDIHLFLDKATGFPLKAEMSSTNPRGQQEAMEFTLSDHKEFHGRKHFTKVVLRVDGKAIFEAELSDFRWVEKLDAANFERP